MLKQLLMHHIRAHAPLDRASSVGRRDGHVTGIGAATAARLASERAAVALLAPTEPQHVAEEIGAPATNLKLIPLFNSVNYYGLGPKRGGANRRRAGREGDRPARAGLARRRRGTLRSAPGARRWARRPPLLSRR